MIRFGRLFLIAPALVVALLAAPAAPAAPRPVMLAESVRAAAEHFIETLGKEAILGLADRDLDDRIRAQRFADLLENYFDVARIGRFVLGRHWRMAAAEEREQFLKLFNRYLIAAYANRFKEYSGEGLTVENSRQKGKDVFVDSLITRPDGPPTRVNWRLRETEPGSGDFRIIDVVIEGVSMSITQRDEFNAVIQSRGGRVAGLNAALEEKLAE